MYIEVITFIGYFTCLLTFTLLYNKAQTSNLDYVMGNRSLNFWLTALSAHASDMSSWLFLAYPALLFTTGAKGAWAGIGLVFCMLLNWQFIAPKIRTVTEELSTVTLSSYFEKRFQDRSGLLRKASALSSFIFYCIYIAAGLVGLGVLSESLFSINYFIGISVGLSIVMIYVFMGGYKAIAWVDLIQGFFLLGVILFIPSLLWMHMGGFKALDAAAKMKGVSLSLLPSFTPASLWSSFALTFGWGLGYFGQPHIITKFMGIKDVKEIAKSKYVGISWQTLALGGASMIGILGIAFFPAGLADPETLILSVVKEFLSPFFGALVLCAILAATTNVMAAQILVVATSITEDFYKHLFSTPPTSKEELRASRTSVVVVSLLAFIIAFLKPSSIYQLVFYAWSGLGGTFGPLLLCCLHTKWITRQAGLVGIISGAFIGAFWPYFAKVWNWDIPALFVVFIVSTLAMYIVSLYTKTPSKQTG